MTDKIDQPLFYHVDKNDKGESMKCYREIPSPSGNCYAQANLENLMITVGEENNEKVNLSKLKVDQIVKKR